MDKELVVREVLSEQMIGAGVKLIERLDQSESMFKLRYAILA